MLQFALKTSVGALILATLGCTSHPEHEIFAAAEQGDYDAALAAARHAQGGGIDGWLFATGATQCRDYAAVVTVLVAQGDFAAAREECVSYNAECAVQPEHGLCFSYALDELQGAQSDTDLAEGLKSYAKETLHFRWLIQRDEFEGRPIERPIY